MADAGFKLTVEGEKEFRKAISDINAILRLNQAELQKVTAEYNASEKSMDAMAKRQEELGGVIERQTAAVEQMEGELARLTDKYGENDKGVIKMRTELDKASASLASMQAQYKDVTAELEEAEAATKSFSLAVEGEAERRQELIAAYKQHTAVMDEVEKDIDAQIKALMAEAKATEDGAEEKKLLNLALDEQKKKLDLLNDEMREAVTAYGAQSREVAEYRAQIANAQTEVKELTEKIEDNNDTIGKAETGAKDLADVFSQISDITGIKIPAGLEKMIGGIEAGTVAMGAMAAAAAGMTKASVDATTEAALYGDSLKQMGDQTGLTVEQIQELQYVGKLTNVQFDSLADVIKDLTKNIYEANNENEDLAMLFQQLGVQTESTEGSLKKLRSEFEKMSDNDINALLTKTEERLHGVSIELFEGEYLLKKYGDGRQYISNLFQVIDEGRDLSGDARKQLENFAETIVGVESVSRDAYDVFLDTIEALRLMGNETDRNAIAQTLFGESAKTMNELIEIGKEGIKQYTQEAREMGLVFGEDAVNSLDQTAKAVQKLDSAWDSAKTNIKGILAGVLTRDSDVVSESWGNLVKNVKSIFGYANGTYNHPGGYALVGERGPEIVDLPAGSRVYPNGEFPAAGTVNNYYVTIPASDIREFNDIVRIAQSKRVTERMK